jgi:prepilin-type N-terminal cleavage/methylation domain-containing protein
MIEIFHKAPLKADNKKHGFSLLEVSMVLVIIGLLIGGVLGGQSLLHAAELRRITTELQTYQTAVNTFRAKYRALPGDFKKASFYWGSAGGSGVLGDGCESAAVSATLTCSGDGDGKIEEGSTADERSEAFLFWQHLSLAGLVEGKYDAISGSESGNDADIGRNVPPSKFEGAGWHAQFYDTDDTTVAYALADDYGNSLTYGAASSDYQTADPILTPQEAYDIDVKVDDGKPANGNVIARYWDDLCSAADDGTSTTDDLEASYRLTDATAQCALYFRGTM